MIDPGNDFGSVFGRQDGPRQAQEAAKMAKTGPRGRQDGPQEASKTAPRGLKKRVPLTLVRYWPPRASQGLPGTLQHQFLINF